MIGEFSFKRFFQREIACASFFQNCSRPNYCSNRSISWSLPWTKYRTGAWLWRKFVCFIFCSLFLPYLLPCHTFLSSSQSVYMCNHGVYYIQHVPIAFGACFFSFPLTDAWLFHFWDFGMTFRVFYLSSTDVILILFNIWHLYFDWQLLTPITPNRDATETFVVQFSK